MICPATMQQRVEILKVCTDVEILIFDEPTAVLTPQEIDEFCEILLKLKQQERRSFSSAIS